MLVLHRRQPTGSADSAISTARSRLTSPSSRSVVPPSCQISVCPASRAGASTRLPSGVQQRRPRAAPRTRARRHRRPRRSGRPGPAWRRSSRGARRTGRAGVRRPRRSSSSSTPSAGRRTPRRRRARPAPPGTSTGKSTAAAASRHAVGRRARSGAVRASRGPEPPRSTPHAAEAEPVRDRGPHRRRRQQGQQDRATTAAGDQRDAGGSRAGRTTLGRGEPLQDERSSARRTGPASRPSGRARSGRATRSSYPCQPSCATSVCLARSSSWSRSLRQRPVQPRLHRAARPAQDRGGLGLVEVEQVAAGHDLPVLPRTARPARGPARPVARGDSAAVGRVVRPGEQQRLGLRPTTAARAPTGGPPTRCRLRVSLATIRSSHGRNGAPVAEPVERAVRLDERLLHHVLGVRAGPEQRGRAHRHRGMTAAPARRTRHGRRRAPGPGSRRHPGRCSGSVSLSRQSVSTPPRRESVPRS